MRTFISVCVVVLPLLACAAFWYAAHAGISGGVVHFHPCKEPPKWMDGKYYTPDKCQFEFEYGDVFTGVPVDEIFDGQVHLKRNNIPETEIRSRYRFFMILVASLLVLAFLFFEAIKSASAVSSRLGKFVRIGNKRVISPLWPPLLISVTSLSFGIFVLCYSLGGEGLHNAVTGKVAYKVLGHVPWELTSEPGQPSVEHKVYREILPWIHSIVATVVVAFLFSMSAQTMGGYWIRRIPQQLPNRSVEYLRLRYLRIRRLTIIASVAMAFAVGAFVQFADWPVSVLTGMGYTYAAHKAEILGSGVLTYWGVVCATLIFVTYGTAFAAISHYSGRLPQLKGMTPMGRRDWQLENGLRFDITEQVKLFGSIVLPILVGGGGTIADTILSGI